jgi:hypothetical protein
MEFRLTYEGYLPAKGDTKVKHAIRRQFHPQLRKLWKEHQALAHNWMIAPPLSLNNPIARNIDSALRSSGLINNVPGMSEIELIARNFARCDYRFVPLVNKRFDLVCALNILFLRRGNPGSLILPGGDVDNRIKTLLDALKTPLECNQVDGPPGPDEDPFFCLLEDDSLITDLNITTDRLLSPPVDVGRDTHQVMLIIQVTLKATRITLANLQLIS